MIHHMKKQTYRPVVSDGNSSTSSSSLNVSFTTFRENCRTAKESKLTPRHRTLIKTRGACWRGEEEKKKEKKKRNGGKKKLDSLASLIEFVRLSLSGNRTSCVVVSEARHWTGSMCRAAETPRDTFTFSYRMETKSGKRDFCQQAFNKGVSVGAIKKEVAQDADHRVKLCDYKSFDL